MDWKLFEAAASGDINFLRQTEAHKLNFNQVTPQQNTVLHIAVHSKQKEFAEKVLSLCPSLLLKANVKGDTPLHVAARRGSLELAELLINGTKTLHEDVESQEVRVKELLRMVNLEKEETALHVAVRNGHFGVVKVLMEADIGLLDLVDSDDQAPLSLALLGEFPDIVLHILEISPSSPRVGPHGANALHAAVAQRHLGIMKILVEKRPAMIKEVDIFGRTPLYYAIWIGELEAIRLLLKCECSAAYLYDKEETSPLHVAAYAGHVEATRELIQSCPYIWELIDKKGRTALHAAVISGSLRMVKYILKVPELVGLINEPDKEGNTPLHLAAVHQKYSIISILARDERVHKLAMNNEFLTAIDIFESKEPEDCFAVSMAKYLLRNAYGSSHGQLKVDTVLRKMQNEEAQEKGAFASVAASEGSHELKRSMFEVHLLVAVLIATVTFAAAFTMPGGYKNEGPDKGMPTFIHRATFQAFVIFDTAAFCFSAASVGLLIYVSNSIGGYTKRPYFIGPALLFNFVALVGMVLAFVTGMYVMLAQSIGLAITGYVMAGCFMLIFFFYWICDPLCDFLLIGPRQYIRNLLFDYGMI